MHTSRNVGRLLWLGAALVCLVAVAAPASAHGGEGTLEIGEVESVGALEIEFPIRITYISDGHAAEEVEGLTVSGKGPDGNEVAPIDAFTPGDAPGVHVARLALPVAGAWELTIDVVEPPATATMTVQVADTDADESTTTTADSPPDAPSDTDPSNSEPTVGEVSEPLVAVDTTVDDGVSVSLPVVAVGLVAAAALAFIAYRASPNRKSSEP